MSFSSEAKKEMCKIQDGRCCTLSEIYGLCLMGAEFSQNEIRITTENPWIIKRVIFNFKKVFETDVEFVKHSTGNKSTCKISDKELLRTIFDRLGYDFKPQVTYRLNRNIIEDECCKISFLRGVFLSAGTVIDPQKEYHLEIVSSHKALCREIISLMLDMERTPKVTERKGHSVIYIKDSNQIEDFLTMLGASVSAMSIMEAKVIKDLRNNVNRKVNCETANLSKTIEASSNQCALINKAISKHGKEVFPENLWDTIDLRIENPTASLSELASLAVPACSKSGMSHRMRKIMEIAKKVGDGDE